jgi:hypothetical protein
MSVSWAVMEVRGCRKRDVELTFYLVRGMRMSRDSLSPFACGQQAESRGGRGLQLCADCADAHGLKPRKPDTNVNICSFG